MGVLKSWWRRDPFQLLPGKDTEALQGSELQCRTRGAHRRGARTAALPAPCSARDGAALGRGTRSCTGQERGTAHTEGLGRAVTAAAAGITRTESLRYSPERSFLDSEHRQLEKSRVIQQEK